jgi:hypothetical protein
LFLLAALAVTAAVIVMTLGPPNDRPQLGHPDLERFCAYVVVAATWTLSFPRRPWMVLGVIAVAVLGLEAAQGLSPGRDPRLTDTFAKVLGDAAGVAAILAREPARRFLLLLANGR